ncbi:MAG: hypothetical protein M0P57_06110 [Syntrophales bacterium]|jgi:maltose-binding protein MalE|nr:hypothetical protein [Syntrophales bacterium]MDY0045738.1 hypothetical protein [Syntrophales bacterium]
MKKYAGVLVAVVCLAAVSILFATATVTSSSAAETEITGIVNATGQLVAEDGNSYFIAQSEVGKKLAALVGKTVQVKGTVKAEGETKTLTVSNFKEVK